MGLVKRSAAAVAAAFTLTFGVGAVDALAAPATDRKPAAPAVATSVKPGAFCSPEGAVGQTVNGVWMKCTTAPGDPYKRWRVK